MEINTSLIADKTYQESIYKLIETKWAKEDRAGKKWENLKREIKHLSIEEGKKKNYIKNLLF